MLHGLSSLFLNLWAQLRAELRYWRCKHAFALIVCAGMFLFFLSLEWGVAR
jgi:hypothetical protein